MPSVETLTTCQTFNAEVCYGGGLTYCTVDATPKVREEVDDFCFENSLADYFLGACLDFKHFGFCVSLLILSKDGKRITNIIRKEACNCRFTPADGHGVSREVVFANWEAVMPSEILTRAENSGKVLFSEFYQTPDGKEQQEVRISPIPPAKRVVIGKRTFRRQSTSCVLTFVSTPIW